MVKLLISLVILLFVIILQKMIVKAVVIFEFQKGLHYSGGRFVRILPPGRHWISPLFSTISVVDVRPAFATVRGQEILTSDGITIKTSLVANYQVTDPAAAIHNAESYQEALYTILQLSLREIISSMDAEALLKERKEVDEKLFEKSAPQMEAIGLKLLSAAVKDIMFPGELKEIFAQITKARKEGLAALERARGEIASLRKLANGAQMLKKNPELFQLRVLQAIGDSSGNTVVLGNMGEGILPSVK